MASKRDTAKRLLREALKVAGMAMFRALINEVTHPKGKATKGKGKASRAQLESRRKFTAVVQALAEKGIRPGDSRYGSMFRTLMRRM